jgi:rubrerythrin
MSPREQIRTILEKAIAFEIEAQHLFQRMSESAGDPGTKQTLNGLYKDEARHEKLIREIYVKELGEEAGAVLKPSGRAPLQVKAGTGAREALQIALEKEANARAYYGSAAKETDEPKVRELLLFLEKEEDGHYTLIDQELKARAGQPWEPMDLDNWVRE